ncbi:MAG: hypothetical protein J1F25_08040 [Prevotellaceae bacterium]|nr:hypothetical protein [Prevotellaceae bacterium]
MKKQISLIAFAAVVCMVLSSCYSSSVYVGDLKKNDEVVRVKTIHNNFFLDGLFGRKQIKATDYTLGQDSYKVKTYQSFVDGVLQWVTFHIYTPRTTEIYLPANYKQKDKQK